MAERWIKLRLHSRHRKIVEIARIAGISCDQALSMAIDWFRLLDSDPNMARMAFQPDAINAMIDTDVDFANAIASKSVGWCVPAPQGLLKIRDARKWISERHLSRERVTRHRRNKNVLDQTRVEADETRGVADCHGNNPDSHLSTADAEDATNSQPTFERLEVLRAARALGIARNNERAFCNYVGRIPRGFQFLARILRQADSQKLMGEAKAKYVYKAVKSEANTES